MMTTDKMAQNTAQAFAACRMRSQLSIDALAKFAAVKSAPINLEWEKAE